MQTKSVKKLFSDACDESSMIAIATIVYCNTAPYSTCHALFAGENVNEGSMYAIGCASGGSDHLSLLWLNAYMALPTIRYIATRTYMYIQLYTVNMTCA